MRPFKFPGINELEPLTWEEAKVLFPALKPVNMRRIQSWLYGTDANHDLWAAYAYQHLGQTYYEAFKWDPEERRWNYDTGTDPQDAI